MESTSSGRLASERHYHDLYENMPVMYFEMDDQGVVVSVNEFGAEQLGYRPTDLVGQSVLDVFHEDDRDAVAEQFQSLIEAGGLASWEFRKRRRDGSVLWVRESARTVRTQSGRVEVMVVCQDITANKHAEKKRKDAERLVRKLSLQVSEAQEAERRRIAVHLHDDVGQSLALAHIKLDQLTSQAEVDLNELLEVKRLLQRSIDDTRSLTFDLASPVLYELGLPDALRSLCERQELSGEGTRFRFDCTDEEAEVPERVAVALYRIAGELVFNVRKHARARNARVTLGREDGGVCLTVEDDGCGFDLASVRSLSAETPGIGLFSVQQRVDLMSGQLQVDTAPGKGSTFKVCIQDA